jgi:NAD(P)-dependent dehydrogenase (short-subunit alcohol dehydrogenase family)
MSERTFDLLRGRCALVTGAGNGIGRAVALRLAWEGAVVCLVDIESEPVQQAAAEIEADSGRALAVVADVRVEDDIAAAVVEAEEAFGSLDIVVANAAVEPADDNRADALDLAVWQRVIETNLTGTFLTCKHGLRALLRAKATNKALICTVSPTGIRGNAPGQDAYSASKAGVLGLLRVLAADYADDGIRVNGVMPGFTDTRANARVFANPEELSAALASIPLARAGTPQEIAAMMAWIASDEAQYATGSVFVVDGGLTAI